jgi:hypothetical protein
MALTSSFSTDQETLDRSAVSSGNGAGDKRRAAGINTIYFKDGTTASL